MGFLIPLGGRTEVRTTWSDSWETSHGSLRQGRHLRTALTHMPCDGRVQLPAINCHVTGVSATLHSGHKAGGRCGSQRTYTTYIAGTYARMNPGHVVAHLEERF